MEYGLLGRSSKRVPGVMEHLKRTVLFFRAEYSNRKFVFHFFIIIFDTRFIPVSGLCHRFSVNGTDFYNEW